MVVFAAILSTGVRAIITWWTKRTQVLSGIPHGLTFVVLCLDNEISLPGIILTTEANSRMLNGSTNRNTVTKRDELLSEYKIYQPEKGEDIAPTCRCKTCFLQFWQ